MGATKALVISAGLASVFYLLGLSKWAIAVFSLFSFLGFGGWNITRLAYKTVPRDARAIFRLLKMIKTMRDWRGKTVNEVFQETVARHPDKPAILFEDEMWTFRDLDKYSNKVANFFQANGIQHCDTVAIFMMNCPQYIGLWIGLSKIGAKASFINYNLRNNVLLHSLKICNPRGIVYGAGLGDALVEVQDKLGDELCDMCFCVGGDPVVFHSRGFDSLVNVVSDNPPNSQENVTKTDRLCYIYTSGTTGLPKAVPIRHVRFRSMANSLRCMAPIYSDDIIYVTLPIYHTNGGVLGVGQMILGGSTIALRRKFSASQFWNDCIKFRCTVIIYIGEVCRYLLVQPVRPQDKQHCVRMAVGNGLKVQIWEEFQKRFNIELIREFYGATEGNTNLINTVGKVGACGFKSALLPHAMPFYLVKVDLDSRELIRDSNGFCIEVPLGEPGELIGKMENNFLRRFDGYENKEATKSKIVSNAFKPGDQYFRTGDVFTMDDEGFVYFADRTGDTFRWKGENVSTTEVEGIIAHVLENQRDVIVYGVEIPQTEGKAGMVAIVGTTENVEVSTLASKLLPILPPYAVPLFVRLIPEADLTGTFKFRKSGFRNEGYELTKVSDPLYILDPKLKTYVPFDKGMYEQLQAGNMRL